MRFPVGLSGNEAAFHSPKIQKLLCLIGKNRPLKFYIFCYDN